MGATIENDAVITLEFNVSVALSTTWLTNADLYLYVTGPRRIRNYYKIDKHELQSLTAYTTPNSASQWKVDVAFSDSIQFLGDGVEV